MLAALTEMYGSLHAAVEDVRCAAGITQRILPVSDGDAHVGAELEDGRVVIGEWEIIRRRPRCAVVRLFLQPPIVAHAAVLEAITDADLLVLCPGSLLTGTLAVLLPVGLREAIVASRARCIYVCNLMTQPGQSDGLTAGQHLALLQHYLGRQVDGVVLNNGAFLPELLELYARHGSLPVVNDLADAEVAVYMADLIERPDAKTLCTYARPQGVGMHVGLHLIRHDAEKLAAQIIALASECSV
jgi:uncharacterized cofD-like protein